MYNPFKKKQPTPPNAEELGRLAAQATEETRQKWVHFHQTVHLKPDLPLAAKIDFFSQPLSEFFKTKYPKLLFGGSEIFWLAIFTAVLESGTHPKEQVNIAVADLQKKYGRNS